MSKKKINEIKTSKILNIKVDNCWKCKKPMKVAYLEEGCMPVGPEMFSNDLIELAKKEGCIIENRHSTTMDDEYNANVCPQCGSFIGMFFYHDYAYVPGDIQIILNEDGTVKERKENKPI